MDYGTITHGAETLTLTESAYLSNRVFPFWWGDAQDGDFYIAEYEAHATNSDGDTYLVRWQFDAVKGQEPEDESDYSWGDDNVVSIRLA